MKSNFKKVKRIESLDELYSCEFIIFDSGGFYKVYYNGWFSSWQVQNCMNLINNGCLFKAEKVEKSSVLVLGYDGIKDYVDALNLGIKLANKGISKVCLDKKKER